MANLEAETDSIMDMKVRLQDGTFHDVEIDLEGTVNEEIMHIVEELELPDNGGTEYCLNIQFTDGRIIPLEGPSKLEDYRDDLIESGHLELILLRQAQPHDPTNLGCQMKTN